MNLLRCPFAGAGSMCTCWVAALYLRAASPQGDSFVRQPEACPWFSAEDGRAHAPAERHTKVIVE